jgi:acyl-CoA thioester hydrolase
VPDDFFRVNLRVHWADTDAAGVVWFGNFFRFFEEAEDELFRALGRTRVELTRDLGILMPRVNAACRFRSPARAEEVLEVGIALESLTERRISYRFEAHERESLRLVAEGSYTVACVSRENFKAVDFPLLLRKLFAGMGALVAQQRWAGERRPTGWT